MYKIDKTKGFTLIELIVSIMILSVIMLSIFYIYSNILSINKKLELYRILQENTRSITEKFAQEIRDTGIKYSGYTLATEELDYSGSGNTILILGASEYCMMKDDFLSCKSICYTDPSGCFVGKVNGNVKLNNDLVVIKNLRFFISGNKGAETLKNTDTLGKVLIVFDIEIAKGKGVSNDLIEASKLHIQTTISEKAYKK